MISVVLVGHGSLPAGMRDAVELVLGPQPRLSAIGLPAGQSPDELRDRLAGHLAGQVLVLADIHGGTPWNVASVIASTDPSIEVVAAFSLPMLLDVMTSQAESVAELAAVATRWRTQR